MTIQIRNLSQNPTVFAQGTKTQFSDNFTRANSNGWGPNWGEFFVTSLSNSASMGFLINSNLGRMQQDGTVGTVASMAIPVSLMWLCGLTVARNQFSQTVLSALSSTTSDLFLGIVAGLEIACHTSAGTGFYCLRRQNSTGALNLCKITYSGTLITGFTVTVLSTLSGATSVLGDTLRIEGRNAAGTWTFTAFKNGTSLGTATDNTFQIGAPCICADSAVAGLTMDFSSYSGGLL